MSNTKQVRKGFEVQTSPDEGWTWYRMPGTTSKDDSAASLKETTDALRRASRNSRNVRLVHFVKETEVLQTIERPEIPTQAQLDALEVRVRGLVGHIPGVQVCQGFVVKFDNLDHGNATVRVVFQPSKVLGPRPRSNADGRQSSKIWLNRAREWHRLAQEQIETVLKANGISYSQGEQDLVISSDLVIPFNP